MIVATTAAAVNDSPPPDFYEMARALRDSGASRGDVFVKLVRAGASTDTVTSLLADLLPLPPQTTVDARAPKERDDPSTPKETEPPSPVGKPLTPKLYEPEPEAPKIEKAPPPPVVESNEPQKPTRPKKCKPPKEPPPGEQLDLLQFLSHKYWLKLPLPIMQKVGPAAQTFAGLLKLTTTQTFASTAKIAVQACLPIKTVRNHLATLEAGGWLVNQGRNRTRKGKPRRTNTIAITDEGRKAAQEYLPLPWWACVAPRRAPGRWAHRRLPWSARALLATVMMRLLGLVSAANEQGFKGTEDMQWEAIEEMDFRAHFRFPLWRLEELTGLGREAIVKAKRTLHMIGIVLWQEEPRSKNAPNTTHYLLPNRSFRIKIVPAGVADRIYFEWSVVH
jgi:DNA-binding MarR family transcriptional regulator